jgi:hypothetical protein
MGSGSGLGSGFGSGVGSGIGSGIGSGSGVGSGCGSTLIGAMGVPQLGQNLMPPGISSPQFGQYMIAPFYFMLLLWFILVRILLQAQG